MRTNRRSFLKTAGAVGLALPFMPSIMAPARAHAIAGRASSALFVVASNGVHQPDFFTAPGSLTGGLASLGPSADCALAHLGAFASSASVLRGVAMSEAQFNGGHGSAYAQVLSASSTMAPGGNPDYYSVSTDESIDWSIARQLGLPDPLVLQSIPAGPSPTLPTFRRSAGEVIEVSPTRSATLALDTLSAGLVGTGGGEDPSVRRRRDVRSLLSAQAARLRSSASISTEDRRRLDLHIEAFADVEHHVTTCDRASAPAVMDGSSHDETLEAYARLVAWAFSCGIVRVATVLIGDGGDRALYDGVVHHDASHEQGAALHAIDKRIVGYFSRFLYHLGQYPGETGTGTLLDDSLAVWTNSNANGAHDFFDTPWIFAGGASGGLAVDRMVDLRAGDVYAPHGRVLATAAHLMGVTAPGGGPIEGFGNRGDSGLVTELLAS